MAKQLHIVAVTAIVVRDGKFLIMKRSEREVAFPGKWTVPGGKFTKDDYESRPRRLYSYQGWYGVLAPAVKREVREEANIEIDEIRYLTDYAFIRPDGIPVLGISFWAQHTSGDVKPSEDLTDFKWVTLDEAREYDLIEGILDELKEVAELLKIKPRPY